MFFDAEANVFEPKTISKISNLKNCLESRWELVIIAIVHRVKTILVISLCVDVYRRRRVLISIPFLLFFFFKNNFFLGRFGVWRWGPKKLVEGLFERSSNCPWNDEAQILIFDLVGALGGPEVGRKRFLSRFLPKIHQNPHTHTFRHWP